MNDKIIGIKELHTKLKIVSNETLEGQSFIVIKNSKPVFKIIPLEKNSLLKYSLDDFKKIQFTIIRKRINFQFIFKFIESQFF